MKKSPASRKRVRRLSVAEAKATLSQVLRSAGEQPTVIHNRGRDVAVLLDVESYERLLEEAGGGERTPMRRFIDDLASLRRRLGNGAEFEPEKAVFLPREPFPRERR